MDQASALAAMKTRASSVADYLPDLDSRITTVNECLATYDKTNDDVAFPSVDGNTLTGFATDRPNVMSYSDLVGKRIDPGSYEPTAAAPLIVQVPAGTTRLDKLDFGGWDATAGADQAFARYILLDLSRVTGDVTIDGLEMGRSGRPMST
ncbi:hypothetical protein G7085_07725 [Tessaracoccus sp. HDW20]|uniref:hypothetical protein n=1 Tax=Tessaracoccus coleopterorum TaxID=2714950 RepID=UPI0018D2C39E|nr:hypothetical protein [Tessaracoccus coleopterorum]NHB84532.1 hypothetical protein [Tessaracoccus coleopterorum]